jgi:hypothetical protein
MPQDRFEELVKLHLQQRRYLDRDSEMRLLEEAVMRHDMSLAAATATLRGRTMDAGMTSESELDTSTLALLRTLADRQGRVARADFDKAAGFYRARAGGGMPAEETRSRVKRLMEANDLQPRRAGRLLPTRRWYRAIET